MSKRNGAKPVTQYRDEGYLPEAMINYWHVWAGATVMTRSSAASSSCSGSTWIILAVALRSLTKPNCGG